MTNQPYIHPLTEMPSLQRRLSGYQRKAVREAWRDFYGGNVIALPQREKPSETLTDPTTDSCNGVLPSTKRGRPPRVLHNPLKGTVVFEVAGDEGQVSYGTDDQDLDDILDGVRRLNWYRDGQTNIPLSRRNLLSILATMDDISTQAIQDHLDLGKRQARRYNQACRMIIDAYENSYRNQEL